MAKLVEKRMLVDSKIDIVRYQLLTHCFMNRIPISETDLQCLTLLGVAGEQDLSTFCNHPEISDELIRQKKGKDWYKSQGKQGLYASAQTVRNVLSKYVKKNLVSKEGVGKRKKIKLNSDLEIICNGGVILDYKMAYRESRKS